MAISDGRGRFLIPRGLREQPGLKQGDTVYYGGVDGEVRLRKAAEP